MKVQYYERLNLVLTDASCYSRVKHVGRDTAFQILKLSASHPGDLGLELEILCTILINFNTTVDTFM